MNNEGVRVHLLGGLAVHYADNPSIVRFPTQKTAALLALLALSPGRRYPREVIIDRLWSDASPENGRRSLRVALAALRRILEPPGTLPDAVLIADRETVALRAEAVSTDVADLEAALRDGDRDRAHAIYAAGPLLPAFYEDWVLAERDRLEEALERSRAHRAMVAVVAPEVPPVTVPPSKRDPLARLPAYLTRFIGRDTEKEALLALWNDASNRVITLTGPGGVGKTRLLVQAASVAPDSRTVRYVPLADARDKATAIRAVAMALGIDAAKAENPAVLSALDALKEVRLLFDNLEQLVDKGIADILSEWLAVCPDLQIVATSRRRLAIPGEREMPLLPLETPTLPATPERLLDFEAVRLFLDRARVVRSDVQVTPRNAETVGMLCDRLGGLPLALELTAAWAGALTFRQMLSRVEAHLLDEAGPPTAHRRAARPDRHRTLRAALETSRELLTPSLRETFTRLSVFPGGFTTDAARAVLGEEHGSAETLSRLRERSLLVVEEAPDGDTLRWKMLPAIYEFARERFDADPSYIDTFGKAHCDYFLSIAETPRPNEKTLDPDIANLRTALDFAARENGDADLEFCVGLAGFWETRGHTYEGWKRTEQALARHPDAPTTLRRRAHDIAGRLSYMQCEYTVSQTHHEAALALAESVEDNLAIGKALQGIASCVLYRETDLPRATALVDRARDQYRIVGDKGAEAKALLGRAVIAQIASDYETSLLLQNESLVLVPADQLYTRAMAHQGVGGSLTRLRRFSEAETHLQTALNLFREIGDRFRIANQLHELGTLAFEQDDLEKAAALYEECLPIFREQGELWATAVCLNNLGRLYTDTGMFACAASLFVESLNLRVRLADKHAQLQSVDAVVNLLVALATQSGKPLGRAQARTAVCLRAADNKHRAVLRLGNANPDDVLRAREEAFRIRLGAAEFARAESDGVRLSLEEVVAATQAALAKIR